MGQKAYSVSAKPALSVIRCSPLDRLGLSLQATHLLLADTPIMLAESTNYKPVFNLLHLGS